MESASQETRDDIWRRILSFAMHTDESELFDPVYGTPAPSLLPLLLVSKKFYVRPSTDRIHPSFDVGFRRSHCRISSSVSLSQTRLRQWKAFANSSSPSPRWDRPFGAFTFRYTWAFLKISPPSFPAPTALRLSSPSHQYGVTTWTDQK
jgi:hypothetical protein